MWLLMLGCQPVSNEFDPKPPNVPPEPDGDVDTDADADADGDADADTDSDTDGGWTTTSTTPAHVWTCFADIEIHVDDDGVVDGRSYEGWDEVVLDRKVYDEDDDNANGVVDSWYLRTYDADGNQIAFDEGGGVHEETDYVDGLPVAWRRDGDGDGAFDQGETWTWNAGVLELSETDLFYDGVVDSRVAYENEDGLPVVTRVDGNADGTVDEVITRTFDDAKRELTYDRLVVDGPDVGTHELSRTTYDHPTLRVGTTEEDLDADGTTDYRHGFEDDERDLPLWRGWDADVDGTWESTDDYTWTAEGGLLTYEGFEDYGTLSETNTYDGWQQLTSTVVGTGFWAGNDEQQIWTWGGTCP